MPLGKKVLSKCSSLFEHLIIHFFLISLSLVLSLKLYHPVRDINQITRMERNDKFSL